MDSILEDNMDKLSIRNNVEANNLSTNCYVVLDMDVDNKNLEEAHINHLSF